MSTPAVHWHEGLFLRPHHFQTAARYQDYRTRQAIDFLQPYSWGCRILDIDHDALSNFRFVLRRLQARLPDGTIVSIPDDATAPTLDLKPLINAETVTTIYLAVPVLQLGRSNVNENPNLHTNLARYNLDSIEVEDENTSDDRETLTIRRLNIQLLSSQQDQAGYSVIPLARLRRSARADGRPELEPGYIPPIIACEAWPPLAHDILGACYDRVGRKIDILATQIQSRGLSESSFSGDALLLIQLRTLNELYAALGTVALTPRIHPIQAYLELCRAIGSLAVFGPTRRTPPLPPYDHDDLGNCFNKLKLLIDSLLDYFVEPEYKFRPFIGAGLRMEVALESAWVESAWQIYIGVQSTMSNDEIVRVLTTPGVLDMKVGSSERVDAIFRYGREGLRFIPVKNTPRVLPQHDSITYFQLATDATSEWTAVQQSLSLAIRLNENRLVGGIQGQQDLTVKIAGQTNTLRFTLFVVPRKSLSPSELVS
jgi:type VI secretion system protein ImpJ